MRQISRILTALMLLAVAAFCGFGYLATFEPPGFPMMRWGYALLGGMCAAGAGLILLKPSHSG